MSCPQGPGYARFSKLNRPLILRLDSNAWIETLTFLVPKSVDQVWTFGTTFAADRGSRKNPSLVQNKPSFLDLRVVDLAVKACEVLMARSRKDVAIGNYISIT